MSLLTEITDLLTNSLAPCYTGFAPTGATLPYMVHRPLLMQDAGRAVSGGALAWEQSTSLYACAGSVEAAYNLGIAAQQALDGVAVGGVVLATTLGYTAAPVEGHYESQITIQANQGALS